MAARQQGCKGPGWMGGRKEAGCQETGKLFFGGSLGFSCLARRGRGQRWPLGALGEGRAAIFRRNPRCLAPCFLQTRARVGHAGRTRRISKTPRRAGSVGLAGVALSPRHMRKSLAGIGRERMPFRKPLARVGYFRKPFRKPFENRWQEWENREFYFEKKENSSFL